MISPFKKKSVQRISALIIFLAGWQLHGFSQENLTPKRDALLDSIEACDNRGDVARSNQFARLWVEKNRLSASPDSLLYAKALVLLSDGLMDEKASDEVRALLEKALQIQVRSLGPDHGDVGRTTSKMGNFYFAMEDLKNTEIWWEKALKIREKAFGPNHKDVATTLYNLGLLYEITDFRKSELCHTRALEIRRAVLDSTHEDIGNSLQALGNLYANSFGDHLRAEPMYQESLAILIKTLGEVHSYVAYTLNSLGELYQYLGDYQKAEQFTLRSYEILCKTAGPESGETGLLLNNLGAYYQEIGDFKKAEFYHRKAFAIASKGESEGTGKATSLLNLGIVNQSLGNYSLAEKLLWESFAIKGRILGEKHPSTLFIKSQLLKNYTQTKAFAKAERMGLEALSILEKTWGETHPESLNCRNSLGILKWAEGKPNEAANWFRKNNTLNQKAIERVFPHFSEKSREVFLEKASINAAYFQSFCLAQGKKQPMWVGDLYNHRLAYKGLLMNTSARWKKTIKTSGDPSLLKVYEEWEGLRNEIGNLFSSSDTARRQSLDSLVEKADKLEKEISGKLAHKESGKKWKFRTWQEVQKALKPGEAAIEMVRLQKFGMARKGIDTSSVPNKTYLIKDLTDTIQYAAIILRKSDLYPDLIILENGNELENKDLKRYQNSIHYKIPDTRSYRSFWGPIGKKLKGIRRVWFSADGIYHNINLNTLQNPASGKYLLDEIDLQLLTSTKQLLENHMGGNSGKTACLVGNPAFGNARTELENTGLQRSSHPSFYLQPDPDIHLKTLPGTRLEIDSIGRLLAEKGWDVKTLMGEQASEQNIKDQNQPGILMVSTHGYFKPNNSPGHNPLVNSGLLLAGSEKTLRTGRTSVDEDGILTAYEAMNLNLDNTDLVVLSACETGLGEIKNGEGVYGLQRAFKVAGAKSIIMSLWKVDDEATQELMVSFYKHWLSTLNGSKRAAFLKAQKELKAKYPNPYYWGAFVMVGE